MTISVREVGRKSPGDTAAVAMDFTPLLRSGELLTGTPTVVEPGGTSHLTISDVGLISSTVSLNGSEVPANGAVQALIAGGSAGKYTIKITAGTDSTPAQTQVRSGTFFVE